MTTRATRPLRRLALLCLPVAALALAGALLPRQGGPPFSPEEALRTFRLPEGFEIQVVAAEPHVASPVAMEVDEQGRIYVVEMPGYPLDVSGSGRVVLLTDANGDGRVDGRTVFADSLILPTGVMRWKKGVLVTDSPDVWYFEDTDGDGRADVKRVVLTGFARSNPQHNTNTPLYGLDNWIHIANEGPTRTTRYAREFGDAGAPVHFPDRPDGPRLPPDAGGLNVRLRPDTYQLETMSTRSQFGHAFDPWGHQFLTNNTRPITHEVVAARYLARNPRLVVPSVVEQVPDYRVPVQVFPITRSPEFQLLTDVGVMTSGTGITHYSGDLFPESYRNAVFVGEPVHNLVLASTLRDHGATFRASRMFEGREFLASTDAWFRPVNFYVGPDGALYLIDYYRRILEHPEWMDDATIQSGQLYAGRERGRIYRIAPTGAAAAAWIDRVRLGEASPAELAGALEHPNGWWRRTAQRLLVDRNDASLAPALMRLATGSASPYGRLHALWTLEGMGRLDATTIERALADPVAGVRENAVRLAELHLARSPALAAPLLRMAGDPDPKVRFQLLLTLGELGTPGAVAVRDRLLFENVEDSWMQVAALSARDLDGAALFRTAADRLGERDTPGGRSLLGRLAAMIAASGDARELLRMVERVGAPAGSSATWWRAATLEGLTTGLRGEAARSPALDPVRVALTRLLLTDTVLAVHRAGVVALETIGLPREGPESAALAREAERAATDPAMHPEIRADAIRLLALSGAPARETLLRRVLASAEPDPVHLAAVRALDQLPGDGHATAFLDGWARWSPAVRLEAGRALARNLTRARLLVDAVAAGTVKPTDLDRSLRQRLTTLDDAALAQRALTLLGNTSASGLQAVERYRAVLALQGDAQRGREVFARVCSSCHQYGGTGGTAFGPDLGQVSNDLPFSLLTDILHPNQSIADGYELQTVRLSDGRTLAGIVAAETPTSITLRLPGGAESTLPRAQVASMTALEQSAMPEGLDAQITQQGMADLIAYLKGGR